MRSKVLFTALCIYIGYEFCGCTSAEKVEEIQADNIQGEWYLNRWDLYNKLSFEKDSIAVFDSHIDTLYRFIYEIKSDDLILRDANGSITHNMILELKNDTLTFRNLLDKKSIQRYSRIEFKR